MLIECSFKVIWGFNNFLKTLAQKCYFNHDSSRNSFYMLLNMAVLMYMVLVA